jgi:hypothetical protein
MLDLLLFNIEVTFFKVLKKSSFNFDPSFKATQDEKVSSLFSKCFKTTQIVSFFLSKIIKYYLCDDKKTENTIVLR